MEQFRDMQFRPACRWVTWLPTLINVIAVIAATGDY
jgi:hypothetical protein